MVARLRALQGKHSLIGDVRGKGLMLGVELVKDRASKVIREGRRGKSACGLWSDYCLGGIARVRCKMAWATFGTNAAFHLLLPPCMYSFMPRFSRQEPAKTELVEIMERMKDLGVLMGKGGLHGNVFRIKPPMCFSMQDADFLVDAMDHAMSGL